MLMVEELLWWLEDKGLCWLRRRSTPLLSAMLDTKLDTLLDSVLDTMLDTW